MVSLAKENLLHEKSRVVLSLAGVVLGIFLILATTGLYYGISTVVENITLMAGADLWVTSQGASGSLHSPSLLPAELGENLRRIDGVQKVAPLIRRPITTTIGGKKLLINVNGYDTSSGLGGPWLVIAGASQPQSGEIIVDRVLAEKNNLDIGEQITLEGKQFRVVGISDETFMMISSMVFVTIEDARSFLPANLTNYFLATVNSPSRITEVEEAIENALPAVSVSTSEQNAAEAKDETVGGFLPIIFVISAIGVLVGILVVGLLVFTMTIEKSREYGVVRAIGATNFYLYKIVLFQALAISTFGSVIGAVISPPLISLLQYLVPEFVVIITPQMMLGVFLLFAATGVIASFIPIRRLSRIDPAVVFKQ